MSPSVTKEAVLNRTDKLIAICEASSISDSTSVFEAYHGALNLLSVVHGPDSVQETQLIQAMTAADRAKDGNRTHNLHRFVLPAVKGALKTLHADVEAGLTGSVTMQASGEVLGDMLALAKVALADGGEAKKNVAAVLVAAAFEDTLRRLADLKGGGVVGRPTLEEIIGRLKVTGVLVGASVSTANGNLKFRNDSLHAAWQNVKLEAVTSCLAFVESLLQQHFS